MLFLLILGLFWCPVVTSLTLNRNLSNFKNIQKNPKEKNQKSKISKIFTKKRRRKKKKKGDTWQLGGETFLKIPAP